MIRFLMLWTSVVTILLCLLATGYVSLIAFARIRRFGFNKYLKIVRHDDRLKALLLIWGMGTFLGIAGHYSGFLSTWATVQLAWLCSLGLLRAIVPPQVLYLFPQTSQSRVVASKFISAIPANVVTCMPHDSGIWTVLFNLISRGMHSYNVGKGWNKLFPEIVKMSDVVLMDISEYDTVIPEAIRLISWTPEQLNKLVVIAANNEAALQGSKMLDGLPTRPGVFTYDKVFETWNRKYGTYMAQRGVRTISDMGDIGVEIRSRLTISTIRWFWPIISYANFIVIGLLVLFFVKWAIIFATTMVIHT